MKPALPADLLSCPVACRRASEPKPAGRRGQDSAIDHPQPPQETGNGHEPQR